MRQRAVHVARRRIDMLVRSNARDPGIPGVGDEVYICRDNDGWIGLGTVKTVDDNGVFFLHIRRINTSWFGCVRRFGKAHAQRVLHADVGDPSDDDGDKGRQDACHDKSLPNPLWSPSPA